MSKALQKPKILIFSDYYLPGYKSGGGMRTIVNMVERLNHLYDFWIVTRDHDGKNDTRPYESVKIDAWNNIGKANVFYLSRKNIKLSKIRELILKAKPDSIYMNSYFATPSILVMVLRRLGKIPDIKIIIANCGELSKAALSLKATKKKLFINFSKKTGLHKNVIWKASSRIEEKEIKKIKGRGGKIFIAPDLPNKLMCRDYDPRKKPLKKKGEAKMVFLSRFMRKKNFKWLLKNFNILSGNLIIDIFAPIEDKQYWVECQELMINLPKNISVNYRGSVLHEKVGEVLFDYQFFILPTISENFGHVFLEAMSAGCPLIISDRTPWLDLEKKGIGWDIPLEKPGKWNQVLTNCIQMDEKMYSKISLSTRAFAEKWLSDEKIEINTIKILNYSLRKKVRGNDTIVAK